MASLKNELKTETSKLAIENSKDLEAAADEIIEKGEVTDKAVIKALEAKLRAQSLEMEQMRELDRQDAKRHQGGGTVNMRRAKEDEAAQASRMRQHLEAEAASFVESQEYESLTTSKIALVKTFDNSDFIQRWMLNGEIMSMESLKTTSARTLTGLRDQWNQLELQLVGAALGRREQLEEKKAQLEDRAFRISMQEELADAMSAKLQNVYYDLTGDVWMPRPPRSGIVQVPAREPGNQASEEDRGTPYRKAHKAPF
jgi:hypothetical protein